MALKFVRFISLLLTGVACGMVFSQVWAASHGVQVSGAMYLALQQTVLSDVRSVGVLVESGALVSTAALLFLVRRDGPGFALTIAGFVSLAAMLLVWVGWLTPINVQMNSWRPETLPLNWTEFRDHWILFQTLRAGCAGVGLTALIVALLVEMPSGARAAKISLSARSLDRL